MRIAKLALYFFLFVFVKQNATAQDSAKVAPTENRDNSFADKLYFGGNIGLSFGSYTMIGLYPLIGYKVSPKLSAGLKITYQYISDSRYSTTYTSSNYGGSVFARYRFIPQLYAHIEYESLNYEVNNYLTNSTSRDWVPFLYVGAGFSQRMGGNTWVNFQILFDVLQDSGSPYNEWDPFYSVGVGVGF